MQIDPETLTEIRAILKRDCVVEVTVTFFDQSESDPLDDVTVDCSVDFDGGTPLAEQQEELAIMLDSLKEILTD